MISKTLKYLGIADAFLMIATPLAALGWTVRLNP